MRPSRRRFLRTLGRTGLGTAALSVSAHHLSAVAADASPLAASTQLPPSGLPPTPGRLTRILPVGRFDGRSAPELGVLYGRGLDARQFTDLSSLSPDAPTTPSERFYIRTAASTLHRDRAWAGVDIDGAGRTPVTIPLAELVAQATPRGTHLLECAGNSDPANFGLMSVASWTGVPLEAVLDRVPSASGVPLVQVTGLDDESTRWESSQAGASWILSRDDIRRTGAFLATGMNGGSLPVDHGAPLRLVVPTWYACASIKWVTRLTLLPADAPATTQMREFATRTHQDGLPATAREFAAPAIDLAAFPLRVEEWLLDGTRVYRVVGIRWGGHRTDASLGIRFKHTEPFAPVEWCPPVSSASNWGFWSHTWNPDAPGRYQIALKPLDPTVPARRLELFFYTREVEVTSSAL